MRKKTGENRMMPQRHWVVILILALLLAGCSPADKAQLQTVAAQAAQTAAAQGKRYAETQVPKIKGTAIAQLATEVAKQLNPTRKSGAQRPTYTVDSDLTELADVTGSELDAAIKTIRPDSPLIGLGQTIVDVGKKEGINAFYIAAHAAWESTWGTSQLAKKKNNLFGYGAYNRCPYECAWTFKTKAECIETVMPIIKANYLTEGGKYYNGPTLRGVNMNYATDPNWKNGIVTIMNSLASKVPSTPVNVNECYVSTGQTVVQWKQMLESCRFSIFGICVWPPLRELNPSHVTYKVTVTTGTPLRGTNGLVIAATDGRKTDWVTWDSGGWNTLDNDTDKRNIPNYERIANNEYVVSVPTHYRWFNNVEKTLGICIARP
jgi:beta-N-acetylglucosaminidase